MAIEAKLTGWFTKLGVVSGPMRIVAVEARHTAAVHHALHEVVPLHSIFVSGPVREIKKILRLAESMILELPEIRELYTDVISNGPIVIFALDWIR